MSGHLYLIALGSNQRHPRHGSPRQVLAAAAAAIDKSLGEVLALAPIIGTAPVGPSLRRYANGALVLRSDREPAALLGDLKTLEGAFGRIRRGQRWRARVLDLDIVLWDGGAFATPELAIPHPLFRSRDFVLAPAAVIAPDWRDPLSGLTLRHLRTRLTRHRPLPR